MRIAFERPASSSAILILLGAAVLVTSCRSGSDSKPSESSCMSAALSIKYAKPHRNAAPPYADCAAGVFAHCGGGKGKRGSLCSRSLDPEATAKARKKTSDSCCYVPVED